MRVLVTADTLGGVWTYTRELVRGLLDRGIQVTLVSFGQIPSEEQSAWMSAFPALDYRPTGFRLEWMHDAERDLEDSADYLTDIIKEVKPDLLHLGQYYYGSLKVDVPRVVVAHSDVLSWWIAVDGAPPPDSAWVRWYRATVSRGLQDATAVVAPSRWMLDSLAKNFPLPRRSMVIYNGRDPKLFASYMDKKPSSLLSVGRLWDSAKNTALLTQRVHPAQVCIVGSEEHPDEVFRGNVGLRARPGLEIKGQQSERELRLLYARSSIYAATSRYEPFGLAPLEAALSGCALIANDIPTFRELWDDAALFFQRNDADALSQAIRQLASDPELCKSYGRKAYQRARERYTATRMVDQYLGLYENLVGAEVAAA